MECKRPRNNVIRLADKLAEKGSHLSKKITKDRKFNTRVIAVTSGKGGVGKNNIVSNNGFSQTQFGKKVLKI